MIAIGTVLDGCLRVLEPSGADHASPADTDVDRKPELDSDFELMRDTAAPVYRRCLQPDFDARVIIATEAGLLVGGSFGGHAAVMRLDSQGDVDPTFGSAGIASVDFSVHGNPLTTDTVWALSELADHKILIGGPVQMLDSWRPDGADGIARLTADGALDATFGEGGIIVNRWGTDPNRHANLGVAQIAPTADALYALSRAFDVGSTPNVRLSRYSTDGKVDASFGVEQRGVLVDTPGGVMPQFLLTEPTGLRFGGAQFADEWPVVGVTWAGEMDETLDADGLITDPGYRIPRARQSLYAAVQDDDGMLLIGAFWSGQSDFGLYLERRKRLDGAIDLAFGVDGSTEIRLPDRRYTSIGDILGFVRREDGTMFAYVNVVSETSQSDLTPGFTPIVVKLRKDGTLDESWNAAGVLELGGWSYFPMLGAPTAQLASTKDAVWLANTMYYSVLKLHCLEVVRISP